MGEKAQTGFNPGVSRLHEGLTIKEIQAKVEELNENKRLKSENAALRERVRVLEEDLESIVEMGADGMKDNYYKVSYMTQVAKNALADALATVEEQEDTDA